MGNRFCSVGDWCARTHRSYHRRVRNVARWNRARSDCVDAITSSSCIIISAPMSFWHRIESSGRNIIWSCVYGDWNCTPCSVTTDNDARETIWNPPESVNKLYNRRRFGVRLGCDVGVGCLGSCSFSSCVSSSFPSLLSSSISVVPPIKLCNPWKRFWIILVPGWMARWYVLAKMIGHWHCAISSGKTPLSVPFVRNINNIKRNYNKKKSRGEFSIPSRNKRE